jgi:hypothetical protein
MRSVATICDNRLIHRQAAHDLICVPVRKAILWGAPSGHRILVMYAFLWAAIPATIPTCGPIGCFPIDQYLTCHASVQIISAWCIGTSCSETASMYSYVRECRTQLLILATSTSRNPINYNSNYYSVNSRRGEITACQVMFPSTSESE